MSELATGFAFWWLVLCLRFGLFRLGQQIGRGRFTGGSAIDTQASFQFDDARFESQDDLDQLFFTQEEEFFAAKGLLTHPTSVQPWRLPAKDPPDYSRLDLIKDFIMDVDRLLERYAAGERNFAGANLEGLDLSGANLSGANLSGAVFGEAYLQEVDLSGANLRNANFGMCCLDGANLSGADLTEASLSRATLGRANCTNTIMVHALLWQTELFEANLTNATLKDAVVDDVAFDGAIFHNTVMPDGSVRTDNL